MTRLGELAAPETIFRAFCMGLAMLVIVPIACFPVALLTLPVAGLCDLDLPVLCAFRASDFALIGAVPGFAFGAGMSVLLDRRRRSARA